MMINRYPKTILIITLLCFSALASKAQSGDNYAQYDIGVAGSFNSVTSDALTAKSTITPAITFNFNQSPYINYILEVQMGKLQGGDSTKDATGTQFSNSFSAFYVRAQLQMGELIDYSQSQGANAFKNFYISSGIGYIINHLKVHRASFTNPVVYTPGLLNSTEIAIPLRVGYEFKLFNDYGQPKFRIDIAYQINMVLGDELDGLAANKNNDSYSQITIGVKYALGSLVTYRKQIGF